MAYQYDLIVIGGGSGGLTAAAGSAKLGARVALVEKDRMGGECLWTGCVPSKAIIKTAKTAHLIRTAKDFGLDTRALNYRFPAVIDRVQRIIRSIEPHDSPKRFRAMGIDVFFGSAHFKDRHTLTLKGQEFRAKRFIIATGSRPWKIPIPGLQDAGYLTNETLFTNKKFPKTLLIIGGGPIGTEMAQAFARLGSTVHILERGKHILSKEDPEASAAIETVFAREGIQVLARSEIIKITRKGRKKIIHYTRGGKTNSIAGDEILVAAGRSPNVEGLNLDGIAVRYDKRRIIVNNRLQTSVRNIYAIGDVNGQYPFTHMAATEAGIALANALFHIPKKVDYTFLPWTTFTDPEVARCGMTAQQAEENGIKHMVLKALFVDNDRAQAEGAPDGFVKAVVTPTGKILGVTIVGESAGEILGEYVLAMRKGLKITDIYGTIHTYPTLSDIAGKVGSEFYEKKLTPFVKKLMRFIIRMG